MQVSVTILCAYNIHIIIKEHNIIHQIHIMFSHATEWLMKYEPHAENKIRQSKSNLKAVMEEGRGNKEIDGFTWSREEINKESRVE